MRQQLREAARQSGKPEAEIVRGSDAKISQRTENAYQILKHVALIGMVKDAPPDLATNKKYFEGFAKSAL